MLCMVLSMWSSIEHAHAARQLTICSRRQLVGLGAHFMQVCKIMLSGLLYTILVTDTTLLADSSHAMPIVYVTSSRQPL